MSKQMNTATALADIRPLCKKLHLSTMMDRLEELYADPSVHEMAPLEIIHDMLTAETDKRAENALKRRLKDAHIRHQDACRECQDFCVWGGYSRGSPTRLPFVFCDAVCQT